MTEALSQETVSAFYRAGLIGLRVLDEREGRGRRFGPDADARWESFKGHLHLGDRIDLLFRDASVKWGAAFAPSKAFRMASVADDEPFGPSWTGLGRDEGRRGWNDVGGIERLDPLSAMSQIFSAWGTDAGSVPDLGEMTPATRLLLAGPSALASAVTVFAGRSDLRFSEQILVAGDTPAHRQMAGLAAVLLDAGTPTPMIAPPDEEEPDIGQLLRDAGFVSIDRVLVSADASEGERTFANLVRAHLGL